MKRPWVVPTGTHRPPPLKRRLWLCIRPTLFHRMLHKSTINHSSCMHDCKSNNVSFYALRYLRYRETTEPFGCGFEDVRMYIFGHQSCSILGAKVDVYSIVSRLSESIDTGDGQPFKLPQSECLITASLTLQGFPFLGRRKVRVLCSYFCLIFPPNLI